MLSRRQFLVGGPGSNDTWVSTPDVETVGGLQQRLLELGQRVRVQVTLA
jgi:hypothetical protein